MPVPPYTPLRTTRFQDLPFEYRLYHLYPAEEGGPTCEGEVCVAALSAPYRLKSGQASFQRSHGIKRPPRRAIMLLSVAVSAKCGGILHRVIASKRKRALMVHLKIR